MKCSLVRPWSPPGPLAFCPPQVIDPPRVGGAHIVSRAQTILIPSTALHCTAESYPLHCTNYWPALTTSLQCRAVVARYCCKDPKQQLTSVRGLAGAIVFPSDVELCQINCSEHSHLGMLVCCDWQGELHFTSLHCTELHWTIMHWTVMHWTEQNCHGLHCYELH